MIPTPYFQNKTESHNKTSHLDFYRRNDNSTRTFATFQLNIAIKSTSYDSLTTLRHYTLLFTSQPLYEKSKCIAVCIHPMYLV